MRGVEPVPGLDEHVDDFGPGALAYGEPLRERHDRGASALETAIIAAVLIAAAVFIGGIVLTKVRQAGTTVQNQQIPQ